MSSEWMRRKDGKVVRRRAGRGVLAMLCLGLCVAGAVLVQAAKGPAMDDELHIQEPVEPQYPSDLAEALRVPVDHIGVLVHVADLANIPDPSLAMIDTLALVDIGMTTMGYVLGGTIHPDQIEKLAAIEGVISVSPLG